MCIFLMMIVLDYENQNLYRIRLYRYVWENNVYICIAYRPFQLELGAACLQFTRPAPMNDNCALISVETNASNDL